jgi:RES domain-containing protein
VTAGLAVWRIAADTPDYEAHDLSGKGAERTGGRWNREGIPAVYASGSRALACLETVVHLGGSDPLPLNRYLVAIRIPTRLWNARVIFDPAAHVGWDAAPAGKVSLDWGSQWLQQRLTLLAEVPSVIVQEEWNVLINPAHVEAACLTAVKVRRWTYDHRLG